MDLQEIKLQSWFSKEEFYLKNNLEEIKQELLTAQKYVPVKKDIIIAVHDQLGYIRDCIDSIRNNTEDYNIFIWDNASGKETAEYLSGLQDVNLSRSEENLGFIIPNNRMSAMGKSPYIILLNSDTVVRQGWDKNIIAWMQTHPDIGVAGYEGAMLSDEMVGHESERGFNADFVSGWSMCVPRKIYDTFGLFDEEHIHFAYGEDSDFSLRIKEKGYKTYAMYSSFIFHHEARTSLTVYKERDMTATFAANHEYLRNRWKNRKSTPPLAAEKIHLT